MIRQDWSLIGVVVCGVAGLAVLAPLGAIVIFSFFGGGISTHKSCNRRCLSAQSYP